MNFNNRTFHLLQKADILTCYEQTSTQFLRRSAVLPRS